MDAEGITVPGGLETSGGGPVNEAGLGTPGETPTTEGGLGATGTTGGALGAGGAIPAIEGGFGAAGGATSGMPGGFGSGDSDASPAEGGAETEPGATGFWIGFGGRLIIAVSRGFDAKGCPSLRGGRTMRTVSFLGSDIGLSRFETAVSRSCRFYVHKLAPRCQQVFAPNGTSMS
jgi:hypothetical protein